jgi:hypothetical protein
MVQVRVHCVAAFLLLCALARAADTPIVTVKPNPSPNITLDGRLTEPAWRDAPVMKLTQQSPRPGQPTQYDTEVKIIITVDRVYFGFICRDRRPGRLAVSTMQRDGDITGDDTVSIVLDTYGDRRTGYYFGLNAAGARADGLIATANAVSLDWDGIWDARTQRTPDGWTAEVAIPTRTLSFARGLPLWGLNVERFVARERITLRWASPTLDSFLTDLSRAGTLKGVGELQQGLGLELSPYATGRSTSTFRGLPRAWQGAIGSDFTWKITPQLVTVFSVNTDFAETEVDARQVNLTRFPLFFPEKRAFFLEGANQYEFGLGLSTQFIPFFSRRIGLLNGEQVPIDAGVKLNGRVGKWNLAVVDVQTRQTETSSQIVPSTNLLAARASYDVTTKLRVGLILTNGDPAGLNANRLLGFDSVFRTSNFLGNKNLLVGGWTVMGQGDLPAGGRQAWGFEADYPNDLWDCGTSFDNYGEALSPALGFLPRPGTRQLNAKCDWRPRPSKRGRLRWIRQEFWENRYNRVTDLNGNVQSWSYFTAPVNVRLETGDRFELNWSPHYEFLATPFQIFPGVVIPPGDYSFTRSRAEVQSSPHRSLQAGNTTTFGTFYDGFLTEQVNYLRWTSRGARWHLEASAEDDFARLREGAFVQRLWQFKGAYAWDPNLVLSTFVQYDTATHNVGANTRLRWTIRPGRDLFIVWNRGWQKVIRDPHELNLVPDSDVVAIKLRWTLRK